MWSAKCCHPNDDSVGAAQDEEDGNDDDEEGFGGQDGDEIASGVNALFNGGAAGVFG